MLFTIKNIRRKTTEQLRLDTLLQAYFVVQNYRLGAAEILLDNYIKQQYGASLKDMCIVLLLNMTFYADNDGSLILLFKDHKYDKIASLITFGNGAIPGSRILQLAFKQ